MLIQLMSQSFFYSNLYILHYFLFLFQDLRPKGLDVGKDELGDMVDKEMAATSAAIEEAVRRIDVSKNNHRYVHSPVIDL